MLALDCDMIILQVCRFAICMVSWSGSFRVVAVLCKAAKEYDCLQRGIMLRFPQFPNINFENVEIYLIFLFISCHLHCIDYIIWTEIVSMKDSGRSKCSYGPFLCSPSKYSTKSSSISEASAKISIQNVGLKNSPVASNTKKTISRVNSFFFCWVVFRLEMCVVLCLSSARFRVSRFYFRFASTCCVWCLVYNVMWCGGVWWRC